MPQAPNINSRFYSQAKIEEVVTLYAGGWTYSETARLANVPVGTVQEWCRKAGINRSRAEAQRGRDRTPPEFIDRIRRMYWEEGMTQAEIGKVLGIHATAVGVHMRKNGIPRRTRTEVMKKAYRDGRKQSNRLPRRATGEWERAA